MVGARADDPGGVGGRDGNVVNPPAQPLLAPTKPGRQRAGGGSGGQDEAAGLRDLTRRGAVGVLVLAAGGQDRVSGLHRFGLRGDDHRAGGRHAAGGMGLVVGICV